MNHSRLWGFAYVLITAGISVKMRMSTPVKIITGWSQKYCVMTNCTVIQIMMMIPVYNEKAHAQCLSV